MKSQRFLSNYRCECYGHSFCNCPHKASEGALFMENIYDVAETLAKIMVICGIHEAKAKAAIDVIIYSFIHYDEIRHRIDAVPRKRLCKEDLIHDLGRKCLMSRMEAQLTYSIIKRAFKAFYHGTSEGGIRNPALEAQLVHSQECLWVHAAKRTAQIFASYEGMFFTAQKNYESQIKCVYKKLYDRMQSRTSPLVLSDCSCENCVQRTVAELPKPSKSLYSLHENVKTPNKALPLSSSSDADETCELGGKEGATCHPIDEERSSTSVNLPLCNKCNCPRLICDCDVNKLTGIVSPECGQGPYKCQWERMDDDDEVLKQKCLELPEDHECPIDCDGESAICDPECECDCECCECTPDASSDDDVIFEASVEEKGEEEELVNEPTTSLQCDISDNNVRYDDCRVPLGHVVEEEIEQPKTIARVSGSKKEASITSTELEEHNENESEELNKLLGEML